MNSKRKKVTDFFVQQFDKLLPGDKTNGARLRAQLDALSDAEFEDYVRRLGPAKTAEQIAERENLPFYVPNLSKNRISIARNYQLARDLGRSLAHRLVMTDPATGLQYVTPHEYPVVDLPVRRQAQTVVKKRSIPEHNQRLDDLTDQPTAESKGSRISPPELAGLDSKNLQATITEFINVRGGNTLAYNEMKRRLIENGTVSLKDLEGLGRAKANQVTAMWLNIMHIGNNIDPDTPVPDDAR